MVGLPESFAAPVRLWWLIAVPVLALLYLVLLYVRNSDRDVSDLQVIKTDSPWKRHLSVGLALLSLTTLTVAWAGPQGTEEVPRERATIVLVMDVSLSMESDDIAPSRLEAAKKQAVVFVNSLPRGFNVALIDFARRASMVEAPTQDRQKVINSIHGLSLRESTAAGEGILTGLDSLAYVPPDPDHANQPPPAAMVVLSDGESVTGPDPVRAARTAKDAGVPVSTIAYGTARGVIRDRYGRTQDVPVNVTQLARMAEAGGGKAYTAESEDQLAGVYADIRRSVGTDTVSTDISGTYAGYGLVLAVLAALGVASLAARWP
ncbi:VWA domain-containing protein [Granulicoccus phenolivorans]|uniref:VWA domain-containing protein n=1 Tax=Granulicoccus phenolivorans TaxID=266854 RepID=UPI000410F8A8|nr:VWA domain-containing protein [Granulicoccus phenolivorans]